MFPSQRGTESAGVWLFEPFEHSRVEHARDSRLPRRQPSLPHSWNLCRRYARNSLGIRNVVHFPSSPADAEGVGASDSSSALPRDRQRVGGTDRRRHHRVYRYHKSRSLQRAHPQQSVHTITGTIFMFQLYAFICLVVLGLFFAVNRFFKVEGIKYRPGAFEDDGITALGKGASEI